ncbi:hypothetical protein AB0M46_41125 [Dactylosporangium sp. NPDC051485]|uniref:hypothetical protein n=1 Tax=Dactylosporangium sp. NPDC051485 TaxID=3154846 RepID=UPI0034317F31
MTVASVRDTLTAAGVRYHRIRSVRPGVVRVEVAAATAARRLAAQDAVLAGLDGKRTEQWWRSYAVGRVYPWRPWCTWVTVNDPGLDWFDSTGRDCLTGLGEPDRRDTC